MDIFVRLLLRTAYWVRHPPSKRWVATAAVAIAVCASIVAADRFGYWPDAFRIEKLPRHLSVGR